MAILLISLNIIKIKKVAHNVKLETFIFTIKLFLYNFKGKKTIGMRY